MISLSISRYPERDQYLEAGFWGVILRSRLLGPGYWANLPTANLSLAGYCGTESSQTGIQPLVLRAGR